MIGRTERLEVAGETSKVPGRPKMLARQVRLDLRNGVHHHTGAGGDTGVSDMRWAILIGSGHDR